MGSRRPPTPTTRSRECAASHSPGTSTNSCSNGFPRSTGHTRNSTPAPRYADIGCGAGQALIKLAQTYPRSIFVGYDSFQGAIEQARRAAEQTGLADRVRFELLDAADGLPQQYDLISTFDVVHDAIDPVGLLRAIRRALKPDGTYLILEMRCADDPSDNNGPFGTLLYGISVLYCMTTSLAHDGAGLGTCGCPPEKVHQLCTKAGFSEVRQLPLANPFNILYEITP